MTKPQAIPPKFWWTIGEAEFVEIATTGYLNAEQCARLWRMEDRNDKPPKRLQVLLEEEEGVAMTDLEKLLRDKQDELRGRPLDWIDVAKERLDRIDWTDMMVVLASVAMLIWLWMIWIGVE